MGRDGLFGGCSRVVVAGAPEKNEAKPSLTGVPFDIVNA